MNRLMPIPPQRTRQLDLDAAHRLSRFAERSRWNK